MNLSTFSHMIFDFDGTLVNLKIDWNRWHEGHKKIFKNYDPSFSHEGWIDHPTINSFLRRYGEKLEKELKAFNERYERETIQGFSPIHKTISALKSLNKSQHAYILTSNSRHTIAPILDNLDLARYIKKIVTRDDVQFIKPDPQPFELIRESGVSLKEYVMIGDSDSDEGFAKNVGMTFVHMSEL